MKKIIVIIPLFILLSQVANSQHRDFNIKIERINNIGDSLITGIIYVNEEPIGKTYENNDFLVKAGTYKGLMRYYSKKGFAAGPLGTIGSVGDFLLEIEDAQSQSGGIKTNVLFHTGFLPKHSRGCILLGPVSGPPGSRFIADDHILRKLRLKFYGTEIPNSCPNVNIVIEITDAY